MSKKNLALFDFDGTITNRDTLFEFILYSRGWFRTLVGLLLLSPALFLKIIQIIPNWKAKEMVLFFFFGGMDLKEFESHCERFAVNRIPFLVRRKAMEKIRTYLKNGDRVVVVSASPGDWVGKWAEMNGAECIATRLETVNGKVTGKISGMNCHGPEKVERIKSYLNLSDFGQIETYGDSRADLPMMKLGTEMNYKPFRD